MAGAHDLKDPKAAFDMALDGFLRSVDLWYRRRLPASRREVRRNFLDMLYAAGVEGVVLLDDEPDEPLEHA